MSDFISYLSLVFLMTTVGLTFVVLLGSILLVVVGGLVWGYKRFLRCLTLGGRAGPRCSP